MQTHNDRYTQKVYTETLLTQTEHYIRNGVNRNQAEEWADQDAQTAADRYNKTGYREDLAESTRM